MKQIFFILAILTLLADISSAQEWVQTNGPGGGFNQIVFNSKKDIFVSAGTLMRSTDNGKSWKSIVPAKTLNSTIWKVAIAPNDNIYITGKFSGDSMHIWRSTDNGDSWTRIWLSRSVALFIGPEGNIYIIGDDYLRTFFRSKNSGKIWDTLNFDQFIYGTDGNWNGIDSTGALFFALRPDRSRYMRSTNEGNSWQTYNLDNFNSQIQSFACTKAGNIFISTDEGLGYRSTDGGYSWFPLSLPYSSGSFMYSTFISGPTGRILYSGRDPYKDTSILVYSDDGGKTWKDCDRENNYAIDAVCLDADSGFYFSASWKTFHSSSPIASWEIVTFPTGIINNLVTSYDGAVIASTSNSLWRLDSSKSEWQYLNDFGTNNAHFIVDSSQSIFFISNSSILRSLDQGKNWEMLPKIAHSANLQTGVVHPNGTIFIADVYTTYKSTDMGMSWVQLEYIFNARINILTVSCDGIFYLTDDNSSTGIYRSDDTGKIWTFLPIMRGTVSNLIVDRYGNLFASLFNNHDKILRSMDKGIMWSEFSHGLTCNKVNSMTELQDGAIAAATDSGVFILPLEGCEWVPYSSGLWKKNILSIGRSENGQLYAGSDGGGVFSSTKLFNDTLNITGAIDPGGLVDYNIIPAGATSCEKVTLKNRGLKSFTVQSYTIVDPLPFSVSDESATKLPAIIKPNDSLVMSICFHPPQTASYKSSIIWNTDIDPSLCGINRETELQGIAIQKSSVQNSSPSKINFSVHPNPVSGNSVTISFTESHSQKIPLSIYDVLGREVYHTDLSAGQKEFDLPIRELSEGVYYVRIETSGITQTKQFIKAK